MRGQQNLLPVFVAFLSEAEVNVVGSHVRDPGMTVMVVVPVEERNGEVACVLYAAESLGKVGSILHRLN